MVLHENFVANLKRIRAERDLVQQDLANLLGISQPAYAELESGKHSPRLSRIADIAEKLGVSVFDLLADPPKRKKAE